MTWIFSLITPFVLLFHDYHVSITLLERNKENKSVEVTHKVFIEDLELAIQEEYLETYKFDKASQQENDSLMFLYFNDHFAISMADQSSIPKWIGAEKDGFDLIWVYIEHEFGKTPEALFITNEILLKQFNDQSNVCHIKGWKENSTLYFHQKAITQKFTP